MAPFKPDAPTWLTGSAKKEKKMKKPQVAKSPEAKMPTLISKPSQSVPVSAKKKKNKSKKKKPKARAGGDLADDEQPSDVSGFVKGQSPTLSTKDETTFVTVEEFDPQEEEVVRIKKEPVSPTLPKVSLFSMTPGAPEDSVVDEHFSTPLQSPVPAAKSELSKENDPPLRSESRIPLPQYPPYQPAKRSVSPSPSSQLQVENPLMSLVKNINVRNEKHQSPSKATTMSMQKFLNKLTPTVPNSTLDQTQTFPPTSPLNTKTPLGQMPNRMLQFDSSPNNHFSPSKSENKCTPVPLPTFGGKGFPVAPRLGTPFRATAGTQEDPLTPADIDAILDSVASKKESDNGGERGVVWRHGYIIEDAHEANVGMTNTTTVKHEQQHEDSTAAEASSKKTKKSKKGDKKRRLEESNALEEEGTITVSAAKKAKKSRKNKKAKMSGFEEDEHHESAMDLDDTTAVAETTQVEVDMQLDEEVMQLMKNKYAGHASEAVTASAPKEDVEEAVVDESASVGKKKKTKKSRKAKKGQVEVEEQQHIQDDEQASNVIYVAANSKQGEQITDAAASTKSSPAPEPKVSKKGRKVAKEVPTGPKPAEEQDSEQKATLPITTAFDVAATMATGNPLLSIAKQVVKFDNNLSFHSETFQTELSTIKNSLASLEQRIQANELRASVRHEILFNAMKKVASDLHTLGIIVCSGGTSNSSKGGGDDRSNSNNSPDSSPGSVERDRLQRPVRATTVAPSVGVGRKGYGQSMTPIPLPKNGNGQRVSSSHHGGRQTPASASAAKLTNTSAAAATGGGAGSGAATTQGRKNQEKLLKGFTAEMDAAKDPKAVEIKGKLCVKYADDLFKML